MVANSKEREGEEGRAEPNWFARPHSDLEGGAGGRELLPDVLRRGCFRPLPLTLLLIFGAVGGWLYCAYWMYRNWVLYRAASGYSRADFWDRVREATGYRISPGAWGVGVRGVLRVWTDCSRLAAAG